jgi:TonB family protein
MMWRGALSSLAIAALCLGPAAAQEADFYEDQLRAGKEAFTARQDLQAVDHFRLAAFGFLGRQPLLSEALVRLAVSQDAAKRPNDVKATLERILEVERRFPGFEAAQLEPQTRTVFRRLLAANVPRDVIAGIPSLSGGGSNTAANPTRATGAPQGVASRPPASTPVEAAARPDGPDSRRGTPVVRAPEGSVAVPPTPAPRPANPAAPPTGAAQDGAMFEPPRYRTIVKPEYPAAALRDRIGGIVLLRVLVSETGKPVEIDVVRQVHPDLSAAAIGAVRRWDFEPAKRNGVAIAAWTTVPVPFQP